MRKLILSIVALTIVVSLHAGTSVVEDYKNVKQPTATSSYTRSICSFDSQLPLIYRNARCGTDDSISVDGRKIQAMWLCRVLEGAKKYNSYVEMGQDQNTTEGREEIKFEGGVKTISFPYCQFGYDTKKGDDKAHLVLAIKINDKVLDSIQFDAQKELSRVTSYYTSKELNVKTKAKITIANVSYPKDDPTTYTYGRMLVGPITVTPYLLYTNKNAQIAVGQQYTNESLIDNHDNQTAIQYKSSDPSVATVDANGLVTALKGGTTTISATWDGITTSYSLAVDGPVGPNVHRIGTYNIRTSGASTDTGDKAWSARRDAVITMIKDTMAFDVASLQEVSATQHSYLESKLSSTYTLLYSGTAGGAELLYRTAKYDVLDYGTFWLDPDPSKKPSKPSWDAEYIRMTVWAKLKDKQSGEIFVFGATHLDLNPVSIREGARVNVEQLSQIAGDYPCIVAGDMNCEPIDHDPHANFGTYFANARQICKVEPRGSYNTFSSGMNPTGASKLIDFVYVRGVEIEDYYVSSSTIGRSLLPSDHLPTVCTMTMLSPNRECKHMVTNVEELRQAAHAVQPNDTIVLADGEYDLAGTSLAIANTCVLEGSKQTILTGQCQLLQLADFVSLTLNGITIRDAVGTIEMQGSIVQGRGNWLRLNNCTIENCTTSGNGLINSHLCALNTDRCIFRNNKSTNAWGVVYITGNSRSSVTITNCLFDGNEAYDAPAVGMVTEADAYFYGNSFINNKAEDMGTVAINCATNAKDIRFVNNTFAQNSIDIESGFINQGIGGSAIYAQISNIGTLTLMSNTIVGNVTACWDEPGVPAEDFNGSAVYVLSGKLLLANNIIAGNFSSTSGVGDVYMETPNMLKNSLSNLFSSEDNMTIESGLFDWVATDYATACSELVNLLGGYVNNNIYKPVMYDYNGVIALSPISTRYANQDINILQSSDFAATTVGSDILNIGSTSGTLTVDEAGTTRDAMHSVPGSMEALQTPTDLLQPMHTHQVAPDGKFLINGNLYIRQNNRWYDLLGR